MRPAQTAARTLLLPLLLLSACKPAPPAPAPAETPQAFHFPPRPTVPPPPVKLFHQDNDTLTLVTRSNASDDEIAALLWQFRDATRARTFDALHLPQRFIDARSPTLWFHVYRGPRCAAEKYTKGPLPCEASYHGAGDYTLGSHKNPQWANAVLRHADGAETQLWDPDLPQSPTRP